MFLGVGFLRGQTGPVYRSTLPVFTVGAARSVSPNGAQRSLLKPEQQPRRQPADHHGGDSDPDPPHSAVEDEGSSGVLGES